MDFIFRKMAVFLPDIVDDVFVEFIQLGRCLVKLGVIVCAVQNVAPVVPKNNRYTQLVAMTFKNLHVLTLLPFLDFPIHTQVFDLCT